MSIHVTRVVNPAAVDVPAIRALAEKALKASMFRISDFESMLPELRAIIADPKFGCFMAVEKAQFVGMMLVALPQDKLIPVPQVSIFYSEGSKDVKKALIDAGLAWGVQQGFTSFWAINVTGRSDAVWARAFAKDGKFKRIGSVMEFSLGG